jgi:hypothetical protein
MLQSETGYIDARPLTTTSAKSTCNARPDHTSGSKPEVAPVERHVRFFLNNGPQDHSLAPIGRLVAFDPRGGFSLLKKLKILSMNQDHRSTGKTAYSFDDPLDASDDSSQDQKK